MRKVRSMRVAMVFLVLAAAGLAACGNDDQPSSTDAGQEEQEGDLARYCELVAQIDKAAAEISAELQKKKNPTKKDLNKAERDFFAEYGDEVDEIAETAPAEIADDVATLVAALKARTGGPKVDPEDASAADQRVAEFEDKNCPTP